MGMNICGGEARRSCALVAGGRIQSKNVACPRLLAEARAVQTRQRICAHRPGTTWSM